jgi:hypothetical protein
VHPATVCFTCSSAYSTFCMYCQLVASWCSSDDNVYWVLDLGLLLLNSQFLPLGLSYITLPRILVNNQLDAPSLMYLFIYFTSLHVLNSTVFIIRRSIVLVLTRHLVCISLCTWLPSMLVRRELNHTEMHGQQYIKSCQGYHHHHPFYHLYAGYLQLYTWNKPCF